MLRLPKGDGVGLIHGAGGGEGGAVEEAHAFGVVEVGGRRQSGCWSCREGGGISLGGVGLDETGIVDEPEEAGGVPLD